MAYLNADIPPIYCQVRKEYLYDFTRHHGESEECVVFGLTSMAGTATLFHIMLPNGVIVTGKQMGGISAFKYAII